GEPAVGEEPGDPLLAWERRGRRLARAGGLGARREGRGGGTGGRLEDRADLEEREVALSMAEVVARRLHETGEDRAAHDLPSLRERVGDRERVARPGGREQGVVRAAGHRVTDRLEVAQSAEPVADRRLGVAAPQPVGWKDRCRGQRGRNGVVTDRTGDLLDQVFLE